MNIIMVVKAKYSGSRRVDTLSQRRFISPILFFTIVVLSLIFVIETPAQKILLETGFENFEPVNEDDAFQVSTGIVKTGKKSLAIFSEVEHRLYISAFKLETDELIVSTEFWVYIEKGEHSFAISIHDAEKSFDHFRFGGPYVEWHDSDIRYHVHRGDPWRKIASYPVNKWRYVRIVANFKKESFDFYIGRNREAALASRPKRNLEFQDPVTAPQPRWFIILARAMTAPGYMDDLLIYEGDKPINLAVEPTGKLTTLWGKLKRE